MFPPLRSEKLVFYCAKILINAGIRMGSCIHLCKRSLRACCLDSPEVRKPARSQEPHKCIMIFFSDCGRISSVGRLLDCWAAGHVFDFRGRTWILSVLTFTWFGWTLKMPVVKSSVVLSLRLTLRWLTGLKFRLTIYLLLLSAKVVPLQALLRHCHHKSLCYEVPSRVANNCKWCV